MQLARWQPLSELSTFKIGGCARFFVQVTSLEDVREVLSYCRKERVPFYVLGKGSNSLFDDRGFDGVVIHVKLSKCTLSQTTVTVGGGYSFALLGAKTARLGLSGLEFASGIPASVGGAIYMNAGAGGAETADVLRQVTFIDEWGEIHELRREELVFSYRHSPFREMRGVIVEAVFELSRDPEARQRQLAMVSYRKRTQPYGEPSCGCVFRNPEGKCAGALIETCGLKGKSRGGAVVSELHANFIVNRSGGKASDVLQLAEVVKASVAERTGIELEMELRRVPFRI